MPRTKRLSFALWLACVAALAATCSACSASSSSGAAPANTNPPSLCSTDPRATVFQPSMVVKGAAGTFSVQLDSLTPWPMTKGDNELVLVVLDAAGKPVTDATLALKSFMPDHGHGSSILPVIPPAAADGKIDVTHVNTFMPGIWQLTFTVTRGAQSDAAVVSFCVPD